MNPAQKKGFTLKSALPSQPDISVQPWKGFTLIELLVVIAIVGVLAAVVLIAINPARRLGQARDTGRKSDISQLATGTQAFYTTNSSYPTALVDLVASGDIKQIPTPPTPAAAGEGTPGAYDYSTSPALCAPATSTLCTEMAVFERLESPNNAATPVWCYRSATGRAQEAASCAP